jgi:hypothetical protein
MMKCPFCQAEQVANTIYCSECGQFLLEDDKRKTDAYTDRDIHPAIAALSKRPPASSFLIDGTHAILLGLKIIITQREIEIPLNKTITLGRVDPALDVFPEIDLTHEGPVAKSVSRRHATIFIQDNRVAVEDLGSVNGTFINGRRLDPYLPEALNNGDILQLGKVQIEVEIRTQ